MSNRFLLVYTSPTRRDATLHRQEVRDQLRYHAAEASGWAEAAEKSTTYDDVRDIAPLVACHAQAALALKALLDIDEGEDSFRAIKEDAAREGGGRQTDPCGGPSASADVAPDQGAPGVSSFEGGPGAEPRPPQQLAVPLSQALGPKEHSGFCSTCEQSATFTETEVPGEWRCGNCGAIGVTV